MSIAEITGQIIGFIIVIGLITWIISKIRRRGKKKNE